LPHNDAKHRAKRWNERVKLVATLFNSLAIVTLAAAVINPVASRRYDVVADGGWVLLFAACLAHILAQYALFYDAEA